MGKLEIRKTMKKLPLPFSPLISAALAEEIAAR